MKKVILVVMVVLLMPFLFAAEDPRSVFGQLQKSRLFNEPDVLAYFIPGTTQIITKGPRGKANEASLYSMSKVMKKKDNHLAVVLAGRISPLSTSMFMSKCWQLGDDSHFGSYDPFNGRAKCLSALSRSLSEVAQNKLIDYGLPADKIIISNAYEIGDNAYVPLGKDTSVVFWLVNLYPGYDVVATFALPDGGGLYAIYQANGQPKSKDGIPEPDRSFNLREKAPPFKMPDLKKLYGQE